MINITTSPKISKYSFCTIQAVRVPLDACIRKLDREIDFFITHNGLSVHPDERPDPFQVAHCEAWIRRFARPRKTINPDAHSYVLKHLAEKWMYMGAAWPDVQGYVTNGSFILAALNLGYQFLSVGGETSPNCCFNMSFRKSRKRRFDYQTSYLPWDGEQ